MIVRRLKDNDYPRKVVVDMWNEAVASMLFQLPCRFNLHAELGALPGLVIRQIELLFRSIHMLIHTICVRTQATEPRCM